MEEGVQLNRQTRKKREGRRHSRGRACATIVALVMLMAATLLLVASNLIGTAMVDGVNPSGPGPEAAPSQQSGQTADASEIQLVTPFCKNGTQNGAVQSTPPAQQSVPETEQQAVEPASPAKDIPNNTSNDFSDSVFIGDSMAEGFQLFSGIKGATFYYERGLRIEGVATDKVVETPNGQTTILDALKQRQYRRVVLILGLNELGWDNSDVFKQRYCDLVDSIREVQPNAEVYLQAILPVTQERSSMDRVFKNDDIKQYNEKIAQVAEEKGVHYLDVSSVMTDSSGALLSDASVDGIHLNQKYCMKWLDYITTRL